MFKPTLHASTLVLALCLSATPAHAGDDHSWTQWDGPAGNGCSTETNWVSKGKDANLWEAEVGLGYSTVVVQDGRLYTMGYDVEAGLDMIRCLDAMTGEEQWVFTYPAEIWNVAHDGGTVNTPSLDGDVLYTLNREGNAYCFDAETGDVKWHKSLNEPNGLKAGQWGFSASPLVLEDQLILNCGKILSLDKATGEVRWQTRDFGEAYGTPMAFELNDVPAVAVLNGLGVGLVSSASGEELYFHAFGAGKSGVRASTPVAIDDALFVSAGRVGGALLAFEEGEVFSVWENKNMSTAFSGCVRIGESLYGYNGEVLSCVGIDGSKHWEERGLGNGAVTGTPDRLLVMTDGGELLVVSASPEGFEALSRTQVFEAGKYWTKPILVNGVIYCRSSSGKLVARDHRAVKDI